jgi:hypothetical protein
MQRAPQRLFNNFNCLKFIDLTSNQLVGSSNLSGRAFKNKGLSETVSPLFF